MAITETETTTSTTIIRRGLSLSVSGDATQRRPSPFRNGPPRRAGYTAVECDIWLYANRERSEDGAWILDQPKQTA